MHGRRCGMMGRRRARTAPKRIEHGKDIGVDQLVGLIFVALPLLLIYLVFQRQRRQQRDMSAVQSRIGPGSRVMTTSGVYGTVVSADIVPAEADEQGEPGGEDTVVLEIAPGVRTTWARQAIARVLDEPESFPAPDARPEPEAEPGAPPTR
jgi:preprotein translocase subunit YajC